MQTNSVFAPENYKITRTYLIVPVGEGVGDVGVDLASGILILSDEKFFVAFGGLGTRRGTFSSKSEVNQIFTFVEGNRSTHLRQERVRRKHKQVNKHINSRYT